MDTLGISAFYHASAAALMRDGEILAAALEKRFTWLLPILVLLLRLCPLVLPGGSGAAVFLYPLF
jgi:hypothetical protein